MRHSPPGGRKPRPTDEATGLGSARGRGAQGDGSLSAEAAEGAEPPSSGAGSGESVRFCEFTLRFIWILYAGVSIFGASGATKSRPKLSDQIRDMEIRMADLVDLAIPANAQAAAEALGLKVHRSVTSGARVRQISREEAEIAVECLRDWGISARILEDAPGGPRP